MRHKECGRWEEDCTERNCEQCKPSGYVRIDKYLCKSPKPKFYSEDVIFICSKHKQINCGECFEVLAKPQDKILELRESPYGEPIIQCNPENKTVSGWLCEMRDKINEVICKVNGG